MIDQGEKRENCINKKARLTGTFFILTGEVTFNNFCAVLIESTHFHLGFVFVFWIADILIFKVLLFCCTKMRLF